MRKIQKEQVDLIDALLAEGIAPKVSPALLEKDIHVTEALLAVMNIEHSFTDFAFCGGTSLSKAHQLIARMSEDVDIKVILSNGHGLTPSAQKKHLSELKAKVELALVELGFMENIENRRALNGNRYFHSQWHYEPVYGNHESLRPYLSLELTARTPHYGTVVKPVGYLLHNLAGTSAPLHSVKCVTVEETMAEKVVSFLRRFAQNRAGEMRQSWDKALVRHIYDVYCMHSQYPQIVGNALQHFKTLVACDVTEFGRQFPQFAEHPAKTLNEALLVAENDEQSIQEYNQNLLPLIFGDMRPAYAEAYKEFKYCAELLINTL